MSNSKQEETHSGVLEGFKDSKSSGNNSNRVNKEEESTLFKIFLGILKISFKTRWVAEAVEGNQHSQKLKEEKTSL